MILIAIVFGVIVGAWLTWLVVAREERALEAGVRRRLEEQAKRANAIAGPRCGHCGARLGADGRYQVTNYTCMGGHPLRPS
jgi:hypothetical protein